MIHLFTEESKLPKISEILDTYGLTTHVTLHNFLAEKPTNDSNTIIINSQGIVLPIDWNNDIPPYVLPESIWLSEETLTAIIYARMGHYEDAIEMLQNHGNLRSEIEFLYRITYGYEANPDDLAVETYQEFDDYRLMHNHAIVRHYATEQSHSDPEKIHYYYNAALDNAPNIEYQAFTTRHYAVFLIDNEDYGFAKKLLTDLINKKVLNDNAYISIAHLLCQAQIKALKLPIDQSSLDEPKELLWKVMTYYANQGKKSNEALALMDAAQIALFSQSYAEGLGYTTKACLLYKEEGLDELYYGATLEKAKLLLSWARDNNPQFFKSSMEAYQHATTFFTKEEHPYTFAEIQHNLGIIYAEFPDEIKKKSIWAAVSSSSFKEALEFFTKEQYPYEYATVCHNFGQALTKYPLAIHSDNFEKALFYFNEALELRNAQHFPYERSLSLLNYIDASWHADNSHDENNPQRLNDMLTKVEEVITIHADAELVKIAEDHKLKLSELQFNLQS